MVKYLTIDANITVVHSFSRVSNKYLSSCDVSSNVIIRPDHKVNETHDVLWRATVKSIGEHVDSISHDV